MLLEVSRGVRRLHLALRRLTAGDAGADGQSPREQEKEAVHLHKADLAPEEPSPSCSGCVVFLQVFFTESPVCGNKLHSLLQGK